MTSFTSRSLSHIETLGDKLRRLREEARVTLDEFALRNGIQPRYLQALEAGRYDQLPGEAYVRNFLRVYADAFHVNHDRVFELYTHERTVVQPRTPEIVHPPQTLSEPHAVNWHRVLKRSAVAACVLVLMVYLGLKVRAILTPPTLAVSTPAQDMTTREGSILVEGATEPEASVTINGQLAFLDPGGHFSERLDLQPGLNIIKVAAKKERSRESIIYRQIVETTEDGSGQ